MRGEDNGSVPMVGSIACLSYVSLCIFEVELSMHKEDALVPFSKPSPSFELLKLSGHMVLLTIVVNIIGNTRSGWSF